MNYRTLALVFGVFAVCVAPVRAEFIVGDYYGTDPFNSPNSVIHYARSGAVVGSFSVTGPAAVATLRGLTFSPHNGLLYASSADANANLTVVAVDSSGAIQQTYTTSTFTGGNISYGKIAFDKTGHFYVGDGLGVHKFTTGISNSGSVIYDTNSNGAFDIKAMPNGNLIVAGDYNINEITSSGALVRSFVPAPGTPGFVNLRGLAFDAASNSLYVSMLGYTGEFFQVEKFNYATGLLLASTTYTYADSLTLTTEGNLLVGSRTQAPALFDSNLNLVRQLSGGPRLFVTQATVPEPGSLALVALGSSLAMVAARRLGASRRDR